MSKSNTGGTGETANAPESHRPQQTGVADPGQAERRDEASSTEEPEVPAKPQETLIELPKDASAERLTAAVDAEFAAKFATHPVAARYTVVVLYDRVAINRGDADRIYKALAPADRSKPILLVLSSPGGAVPPAYFIGKLCREYTDVSFEVAVPRAAKSAATLISCAADRIHMGSLSELGPIDPQIGNMPALAVKHSLEHLSELVTKYPESHGMLSDYLAKSLSIEVLGYYERAAHSAVQYAERLLRSRISVASTQQENSEIAGVRLQGPRIRD